jgi:hypothetical protein
VTDPLRAETALRLAGERLLLSGAGRGGWGGRLGEVATALVLLCDLPQEVAEEVVADYALARSYRGQGWGPEFRAARRHPRRAQRPARPTPTPPTVVRCDTTVDLPDGRAQVRSVVFRDDACEVAVRYAGKPAWARRRGRGGHGPPMPGHPRVADDTGAHASAHFSGGGGDDEWEGRWQTDAPLSPQTRWLEIDGVRVELGASGAPAEVRVEPLTDEPLAQRYLWHRAAVSEGGPPETDPVLTVLVELGLIDPADPMLEELAAVTGATRHGRYRGKRPRVTREPWASLFAKKSRRGAPTVTVPVAAATPEFDGTVAVVYDLEVQPDVFELQAEVLGDGAVMSDPYGEFDDGVTGVPIAFWAEDDRGNSYLGRWDGYGSGEGKISGDLIFHPALDRKARHLTLQPTGLHHRAVIEIPLPEWGQA